MSGLSGAGDLRVARRLADLEAVIERGKAAFIEVGEALIEIRESKLYRAGYSTFEAYCQGRWGWDRSTAYRHIAAAEVIGMLPTGDIPTSERQVRELVPLKDRPEVLRNVWAGVVEEAEATETPVTAPLIRAAVRDYIRGEAASSESEMQEAAAWMTPEDRHRVSPEMLRQRGELMRLVHDLSELPDAIQYADVHGSELGASFLVEARTAAAWLTTLCEAMERETVA